MTNIIPQDPIETWILRIAQADAALTQQAYWVARHHREQEKRKKKPAPHFGATFDLPMIWSGGEATPKQQAYHRR